MNLPSLRLFKFYSIKMLILMSFSLLNAEDYFALYPSSPLLANAIDDRNVVKEVIINSIDDTFIDFTYKGSDSGVSVSFKNTNITLKVYDADALVKIHRLMETGELESALEQLRPIAYPLVPYLLAPSSLTNFHPEVYLLARLLYQEEKYDELIRLMVRLPLKRLSSKFHDRFLDMLKVQLNKGYVDEVRTILSRVEFENNPQQIPGVMELTVGFLQSGKFSVATDIYQRVSAMESVDEYKAEADLMLVYCQLLAGEEAASIRAEIDKLDYQQDDRLYSLYKMIRGRVCLIEGDIEASIMEVSQAIVYLDYSSSWAIDALYSVALAYDELKNEAAIMSINRVLALSFPESKRIKEIQGILNKYSNQDETK